MAKGPWHRACSRRPMPSADPGQDRTLAPNAQEPHPAGTRKDQKRHHQTATIATSVESRLNSNPNEPEPPSLNSSDCPKPFEDGHACITLPAERGEHTVAPEGCKSQNIRTWPNDQVWNWAGGASRGRPMLLNGPGG